MQALLAILKGIPNLLALIVEFISVVKAALRMNPEQFIEDSHKAIEDLKKAKSAEEKKDAAKAISDLLNRL